MKRVITAAENLTDEQMEQELKEHFEEVDRKIDNFMKKRSGTFNDPDLPYTYIEHHSIDYMIHWYIRFFNENVKECGDGFASDWDDDDTMYILYNDGSTRSINPSLDDGTKRIKVDGINSIIVDGGWGTAYAGKCIKIYNMREAVDYGKWGYNSVEQRYNDFDDIRVEFDN